MSARERQEGAPVLPDVEQLRSDAQEIGRRLNDAMDRFVEQVRSIPAALTPPPSAPSPVDAIPVGRENAKLLAVSIDGTEPVIGMWHRAQVDRPDDSTVYLRTIPRHGSPQMFEFTERTRVTTVTPLHVIPAELAEEIKAWSEFGVRGGTRPSGEIVDAVAEALLDGEVSA